MKILLTGASGFIGGHLVQALRAAGHTVVAVVRRPERAGRHLQQCELMAVDFNQATSPAAWQELVQGIDAVVNAVGILRESRNQSFNVIHHLAPVALFDAAAAAGVQRIVQISALGADTGTTAYHRSKKAADDHLATLQVAAAIVQPSVVFGRGSGSARLFGMVSRLPVIPLPGDGQQALQPVHIHDLIDGVVELLEAQPMPTGRLPFVGPEALSLRELYVHLRQAQGISSPARFLSIPMTFIETCARVGSHLPGVMLDRDTLTMLNQGSVGDSSVLQQLLGHPARPIAHYYGRHK